MPAEIGTDIAHAARLLRDGQLVAFATETVYGLGANALDVTAVADIFAAKNRPTFDPLIVHIHDRAQLAELVTDIPDAAAELMDRFWPGPLTLVLPKRPIVPDLVTAGLPTVAVRMPDHPQALELLRQANVPVAAPSANPFGCISPTTAAHVAEQLGDKIDTILDGGPCRIGLESTVLRVTADSAVLLRPGGLSVEEIEAVIGPVMIPSTESRDDAAQPSPGLLTRHYAPRTPLVIHEMIPPIPPGDKVGLLTFTSQLHACDFAAVETLSSTDDLIEAAANFFAALRRLDALKLDRIIATPFPDYGLGRALNDRLRRAATSH